MNRSHLMLLAGGGLLVLAAIFGHSWLNNLHANQQPGKQAKGGKDLKGELQASGKGSIRIRPDSARVFFVVETYAQDILTARADNGKKVKSIMDALTALKIDDLKMKSSDVNVQLVRDTENRKVLPKILGYHITHSFTVLVQNKNTKQLAEQASMVLDTALSNGATGVQKITFFKQEIEDIHRRAMKLAVQDAMANAKALAGGADITIGRVERIYGANFGSYNNVRMQNTVFPVAGERNTPLVAGDLIVTCNVNVTCKY